MTNKLSVKDHEPAKPPVGSSGPSAATESGVCKLCDVQYYAAYIVIKKA